MLKLSEDAHTKRVSIFESDIFSEAVTGACFDTLS
jgi:hypothetical protein